MKISLIEERKKPKLLFFNTGDILVFYSDKNMKYDYGMVIFDREKFKLLSLFNFMIKEEFESLNDTIRELNYPKNSYRLIEVIKSEDVELRRVFNG